MKMFGRLRAEGKRIIENIIEISYFMRGSMKYEDILLRMSYAERDLTEQFLKKRLEGEAKKPHPVY